MLEIFVWKRAAPQTLGTCLVLSNKSKFMVKFAVKEDKTHNLYVMYPTGLLPVPTS